MKVLLDTNVIIWSQTAEEKLGNKTAKIITDERNNRCVSSISFLEIAQLTFSERLRFTISVERWITETTNALLLEEIPLTKRISISAYALPGEFHRDPADRILVATAREYGLTILTTDKKILSYKYVESLNARH